MPLLDWKSLRDCSEQRRGCMQAGRSLVPAVTGKEPLHLQIYTSLFAKLSQLQKALARSYLHRLCNRRVWKANEKEWTDCNGSKDSAKPCSSRGRVRGETLDVRELWILKPMIMAGWRLFSLPGRSTTSRRINSPLIIFSGLLTTSWSISIAHWNGQCQKGHGVTEQCSNRSYETHM